MIIIATINVHRGISSMSMVIGPSVGRIIWHSQVSYDTWHACALCSCDASVRHMLVAHSMVVLVSSVINVSYPLCYSHVSDVCDARVQRMWYLTHTWHKTLVWGWHVRFTYVYHYHSVSKISMAHTWQKHMTHIYNVIWKPCGCHQLVFAESRLVPQAWSSTFLSSCRPPIQPFRFNFHCPTAVETSHDTAYP